MPTPLDLWLQGRKQQEPVYPLPLELTLGIADTINEPEDIVNFALANPAFISYWIHLTELVQEGRAHEQDPESNPHIHLPALNHGPIVPERVATFQRYSERTMKRMFSPEIQRLIMLILFMPNASHKIYDIGFRRDNPQVGDQNPFPLLFQRRVERFNYYYRNSANRQLLFTFKNLNQISPYSTAIRQFATDFARKSLSIDPSWAQHSPPSFVPNQNLAQHFDIARAVAIRDDSKIQDLNQLHETERERLMLAFYQYEALCATSAKINGYWEIRRAVDIVINGVLSDLGDWNARRVFNSPLAFQSTCQIERVVTVYCYVRMQWLLMFHELWSEYKIYLNQAVAEVNAAGFQAGSESFCGEIEAPAIFTNQLARLEMIDILCSRGLLFLYEVLHMNGEQRREFLVNRFYPVRTSSRALGREEYLLNGIFDTLDGRPALNDSTYSDSLENVEGPNLAWLRFNFEGTNANGTIRSKTTEFAVEANNGLRRAGWVFWNDNRCKDLSLDNETYMRRLRDKKPASFLGFPDFLDGPHRIFHQQINELSATRLPDAAWLKARELFMTPKVMPYLLEFGVLGETWRLGEEADGDGEPLLPDFSFNL
ncbi:hypothetical protein E0Z10_g7096 [Xylaria hypoxylon]|uniref:Uncharacterized protein n=1 Tax=Xylaria hypoxylon TaxID=37992 RepID=A0A4Z0YQK1_9PEZI|nr:hypothetical protein E0Z10_g7096 [Xylaria hypoxylon]